MRQITKHLTKTQYIKYRFTNKFKQKKLFNFLNSNGLITNQKSLKNRIMFSRLIQLSSNTQNKILFNYSTENNKNNPLIKSKQKVNTIKSMQIQKNRPENISNSAQNVKNEQNTQKTIENTQQQQKQNLQKINKGDSDLQMKNTNITNLNILKNINDNIQQQKQKNQQKPKNISKLKQKEQNKQERQNLQKIAKEYLPLLPQILQKARKFDKITTLAGIASIIAMIFGFIQLVNTYFQSKFYKKRVALEKYRKSLDVQYKKQFYVQGSLLETDLKKYILNTYQNKIKIIGGMPGIGKTTVVNFLIQKLRSQKKQKPVYYINLRNLFIEKSKNPQKIKQEIQNLLDGVLQKWALKQGLQYKEIKIIIDDINELQKFQNKDYLSSILMGIESFYTKENVDMICISSSSSFVQKVEKISSFKKAARFFIVHHQTGQNYKKFVEKVINKHCPTMQQQAKKYMISQQYSLRKIVEKNLEFKTDKKPTQTQIKYLKDQEKKQFTNLNNIADGVFKLLDNTQVALTLFEKILQNPQKIQKQNCDNMVDEVISKFRSSRSTTKLKDAIEILAKQNMLAYCKPRQMIYKKVLQNVYSQQKEQLNKNK